jgi:hypothetical protein
MLYNGTEHDATDGVYQIRTYKGKTAILRKSRVRRRACTDLCGGRPARDVPTATGIRDLPPDAQFVSRRFSVKPGFFPSKWALMRSGFINSVGRRAIASPQPVIYITRLVASMMYIVNRLTMGRLSKVVLLAILLSIAGFPGATSLFCAHATGSHGHACCMEHEQANSLRRGASSAALLGTSSCCKVEPIESTPIQPILLSGVSHDSAYGLHATSDVAGALPAPTLLLRRGSPLLTKLQHPPVHALLCTFLV